MLPAHRLDGFHTIPNPRKKCELFAVEVLIEGFHEIVPFLIRLPRRGHLPVLRVIVVAAIFENLIGPITDAIVLVELSNDKRKHEHLGIGATAVARMVKRERLRDTKARASAREL